MLQSALQNLSGAINYLGERMRSLETQMINTPVRYTVAGAGYLTANANSGTNSIAVSTLPEWAAANEIWVAIGPGDSQCEVRKITGISDHTLSFGTNLTYNHLENDSVAFFFQSIFSVKLWGAKGDNSTNDTTAVAAAILQVCDDYVGTRGAVLYFPAGIYLIYSTLTISGRDYIVLAGDGRNRAYIQFQQTNGTNGLYIDTCTNIAVRDLTLVGNNTSSGVYCTRRPI